jgi:hypothetical protein
MAQDQVIRTPIRGRIKSTGNAPVQENRDVLTGLGGQGPLVFVILEQRESTDPFAKVTKVSYYTYVMGDTYPFKDLLKKYLGWDPDRYLWRTDKNVAKQVAEELRNAGAEVIEVSRFYPEYDIIKSRIDELIKRGAIKEVLDIAKELSTIGDYNDDYLLPLEMQIRYIVNIVRRKYQLNADFEDVLRKMLEGQIGEEQGWLSRKRLQKLAEAYVKLRDMGLANMTTNMIRLLAIIYETEYEKHSK